jgi:S-DNA-T family DNA segregation ATPase FtsK/SpoIIIE
MPAAMPITEIRGAVVLRYADRPNPTGKSTIMAKKSRKKKEDTKALYLAILWALAAGLWLLVAAAMISYAPADHPAHAYGVPNETIHNWVGKAGALVAHKINLMVGPGAWVALIGAAVMLVLTGIGRSVTQPVIRVVGLIVMTICTSALISVAIPTAVHGFDAAPQGAGGLLATLIDDQLTLRFAVPGTMMILTVGFWVGAVLTADQFVLAAPKAMGAWILRLTHLPVPNLRTPQLAGRFAGLTLPWRRSGEDESDTQSSRKSGNARRRRKDAETAIDEDAGGLGATESFDLDEEVEYEEDEYEEEEDVLEDEEEDEEEEASPGAPGVHSKQKKSFSKEALRAKMQQLPINFAPKSTAKAPPPREVDLSGYEFPGMDLLLEPESNFTDEMERIVRDQAMQLESALQQYRIEGEVVGIDSGPVITLFEVRLAPGTKVSRLSAIDSDLARALKAQNIRIVANMAGKDTVGIEVPNLKKERVRLKELMANPGSSFHKMKLPMFLGKDASGNPLVQDLSSMPHMLIAGTTGSGKSVCMNSIIMSFLFTKRPDELKLVLVDPKMVEMAMFKNIPHLMCPVVTEMTKAAAILEWAVTKMDERYELLAEAGVRDINSYNELGWDEIKERMEPATEDEEARIPKKLPYMVFVIDELADLMMTTKEVETSIVRIAQKARAVGIHLILATQRPQANVVTGLIKSNMPCRVAFKVASGMDSRIVLDQKGGELLLGQGDMLFLSPRSSKLTRSQGTLVDDGEVRKTVKFLKTIAQQHFEPSLVQIKAAAATAEDEDTERDPLFNQAVDIVIETQRGSVSLLQRRLTIGYSRSSRLIEQIAAAGLIGEYKGSQAREVTITAEEWQAMKAQAEADAAGIQPPEDEEELEEDAYEEDVNEEDSTEDEDGDVEEDDDEYEEDVDEEEEDDSAAYEEEEEYEDEDSDDEEEYEEDEEEEEEDEE